MFKIDGAKHGFTSCPFTVLYHLLKVPGPIRISQPIVIDQWQILRPRRNAQSVSRLSRWIGKCCRIWSVGSANRALLVVEVMQNYAVPPPLAGRPQLPCTPLPPHAHAPEEGHEPRTSCSSESYSEVQKLERLFLQRTWARLTVRSFAVEFRSHSQSSSRLLFTTFPGTPGPK